jgi:hypothetical protein
MNRALLSLLFFTGCFEAVDVDRRDAGNFAALDAGSDAGSFAAIDAGPDAGAGQCAADMDAALSWTPTTLDFGHVQRGSTVTAAVTFSNQSCTVVELSGLMTREGSNPSNLYRVTMANVGDLTRLSSPAATRDAATNTIVPGTAALTLSFRPVMLGARGATLRGSTNLPAQPAFTIPLRGFGGGPDIDVHPATTLDFGRIASFPGSTSSAPRRVTVRNVGTRPIPADPRANLKLGVGGAGPPYWTVTPKNAESSLSEICVGRFDSLNGNCTNELSSYDPGFGIEASSPWATLDIPIRIAPANTNVGASGYKEWEVTFFSNDPDEPEVRLTVKVRPVTLPPCNFTVTPTSLAFDNVMPLLARDLTFRVCNAAPALAPADVCLIGNLDLGAGSHPTFSLPGGAVQERELAPQECLTVVTRAAPLSALAATPTTVRGSVTFAVSSPQGPQGQVQLTATLGADVCTSGVARSCDDEPVDGGDSGLAGVCMGGGCVCNAGFELNPLTERCRAIRPTTRCTVGMNETCNADPLMSAFAGTCVAGTCACSAGFALTSSGTCTVSSTAFCIVSDGMGRCSTEALDGGSAASGLCGTSGITAGCACSGARPMPLCGGLCPPTAGRPCVTTNCGSINCLPPLRCARMNACSL